MSGADTQPVEIRHQVRVEWSDTDASGHYHHSSVLRWVEQAEAALYRRVGVENVFGVVPRVHYEVDYLRPLWFGDEATVTLWVQRVGPSSLHLRFEVAGGAGSLVARGHQIAVHVAEAGGVSAAWPAQWRQKLESAAVGSGGGRHDGGECGNDEGQTQCESR